MSAAQFGAVIVCDDLRKEVNGKDILIGVYAGDIVLASFPAWFPCALWIEIETVETGEYELLFRLSLTGKPHLQFKVRMEVQQPGTTGLGLPGLQLQAENESELIIEALDGEDWKVLKRKRVIKGNVSLPFPT